MIAQIANAAGGALGDLMNLVPTPGKLVILPFAELDPVPIPAGPPYIAMFNPENWQVQNNVQYYPKEVPGSNRIEYGFNLVSSPSLTFDLLVDGTGASGENREVLADITLLKEVILFNGVVHRPNYLVIIWGTNIFKGVLTSMTVKHTLFRPNGTPLRANITLSFAEQNSRSGIILAMNLGSSDLTHRRLIKTNDRLDLICSQIYGDSRHYLNVASANNLSSFRQLPVGTELDFPPIEK